jgi:hypothetical protein
MYRICLTGLWTACALMGQNPYETAPKNYQLEFENEKVRVSRARFWPGDKLPVHEHPAFPTVYVYLTDGGPIMFWHKEFDPNGRPAVKAGAIRFHRGSKETHEVEYLGDTPSEFLRVELKLEPKEFARGEIRRKPDDFTPWDHPKVRLSRCTDSCSPEFQAVVVSFDEKAARWWEPGQKLPFDSGHRFLIEVK